MSEILERGARIEAEARVLDDLIVEVERVVLGQRRLVERLLIGILTDQHVLLEGVPGLAKTLVVSTLAQAVDLSFHRIQFTPDLLPSDVTGTQIYNPASGEFSMRRGPVFANLLLADEINRAPAKVQSALLEAMQERQVTIGDTTFPLPRPFFVMATQNPLEQQGTYPLPEAQLDRFLLKVIVDYPARADEQRIVEQRARTGSPPRSSAIAWAVASPALVGLVARITSRNSPSRTRARSSGKRSSAGPMPSGGESAPRSTW